MTQQPTHPSPNQTQPQTPPQTPPPAPERELDAFDRFNAALKRLDTQLQELRDRFDESRSQFEEELRTRRDQWEARVRESALFQRTERARRDIEERVERNRDHLFEAVGLASRREVRELGDKLDTLQRKLDDLAGGSEAA